MRNPAEHSTMIGVEVSRLLRRGPRGRRASASRWQRCCSATATATSPPRSCTREVEGRRAGVAGNRLQYAASVRARGSAARDRHRRAARVFRYQHLQPQPFLHRGRGSCQTSRAARSASIVCRSCRRHLAISAHRRGRSAGAEIRWGRDLRRDGGDCQNVAPRGLTPFAPLLYLTTSSL